MVRRLRSGYTTGACAAAAAKAAALLLTTGQAADRVEIPFPDGSRVEFAVRACGLLADEAGDPAARASIIKDAGDDPDVTNGAEIIAVVRLGGMADGRAPGLSLSGAIREEDIWLTAGPGVGRVSKPGLAVAVGEPAINPVPRRMIRAALREALPAGPAGTVRATADNEEQPAAAAGSELLLPLVEIGVAGGEELATRTLNHRLGIVGGLSILGTTGIVRPVSAEAWQATIIASLDVARAAGLREVVLSTGRSSEKAVLASLGLPEEAGVMMGDYLAFSLREAGRRGFARIHLAAMWAKIIKAALGVPQTHVRHGALEMADARRLLVELAGEMAGAGRIGGQPGHGQVALARNGGRSEERAERIETMLAGVNTGREILERLTAADEGDLIAAVCRRARAVAAKTSGRPVHVHLVGGNGKVIFDE